MIAGSAMSSIGIDLAGERDDARGAEDGRQREDHRHRRGDERAEGQQQDQQRDAEASACSRCPPPSWRRRRAACVMLASPNCSTARLLCRAATPLVASRIGWTLSIAFSGSPVMSNWTSAEWPSLETSAGVTLATFFCLATVLVDVGDRGLEGRVLGGRGLALDEHHLARGLREAGASRGSSRRGGSHRRSSWRRSASSGRARRRSRTAITMNASQPKMAVLRWRALQCPARAAMPLGFGRHGGFALLEVSLLEESIGFRRALFGGGGRRRGVLHDPGWGCGCPPPTVRSSSVAMAPSGESHSIFVVQQTFTHVRRGYDPDEVDRHLELVAEMFSRGRGHASSGVRRQRREAEPRHELDAATLEAEATLEGARKRGRRRHGGGRGHCVAARERPRPCRGGGPSGARPRRAARARRPRCARRRSGSSAAATRRAADAARAPTVPAERDAILADAAGRR